MAHFKANRLEVSQSNDRICITRGIKNVKWIKQSVPRYFKERTSKEISNLSPMTLSNLHRISKPHEIIQNTELANFLEKNKIPMPTVTVSTPLFNGTLVFVQIIFNRPSQPSFMMSTADIQTAINYSTRAVIPIHRYASQYGPNTINISQNIIQFNVNLTGNTFNDVDLQGWVDTIVTTNNLVNSCIMVLIDTSGPRNSDASGNTLGYHSITGNNRPYCCCNVFGHNLTIDDSANIYAQTLSHEIAEMVVDPQANQTNPEVCDACAGNCHNVQNDFFDNNNKFIGGSHVVPPPFSFSFFINSLIKPDFYNPNTECAIPGSDQQAVCIYAPPSVWGQGTLTSVSNVRSVSGHFSNSDQRDNVMVGTTGGKIHEIFWKPEQVGIEGEDDLPVSFSPGSIVSVAGFYNSNDQLHIVIVGTTRGKIHEIFWKPEQVGIEIHGIIAQFNANSIVRVAGFYSESDDIEHAIVCTTDGKVHELWVKQEV